MSVTAGSGGMLRAVMAGVPVAIAVVDAEGRVIEANAVWRATGPGPGEDWREVLHPDERAATPPAPAEPFDARVRVVGAGGPPRWCAVAVRPAEDGAGAAVTLMDADETRRTGAERAALRRIAAGVTRGDDTRALFAQVAEEAGLLVAADGAGVVEFDPAAGVARMRGSWSPDPGRLGDSPAELPLVGPGATARVYATGRSCRVDNAPRAPGGQPWAAAVAVPIRAGDVLWGALGAVSLAGSALTADAEERLEHFGDLVGLAISNARARDQLVRQARTDPLTGLPHHGAFHRALADEIARTSRFGGVLSLAVIDIDHFKTVNDHHGHEVGDATLQAVASRLADHARVVDTAARVGGEEFAWVMPGTPLPGAHAAAERFRTAVAVERFGPVPALTVSVGVAQLFDDDSDGSALFRRADRALYAAKAAGRDRTMAAGTA